MQVSASKSQKSATGGTPFDEIATTEQREKERVAKEFSAMEKEKVEVSQAVSQKEQQAGDEMKEQAKKEIQAYVEDEPNQILKDAKKNGKKECEKLDESYFANEEKVADELVKEMLQPDFPL